MIISVSNNKVSYQIRQKYTLAKKSNLFELKRQQGQQKSFVIIN